MIKTNKDVKLMTNKNPTFLRYWNKGGTLHNDSCKKWLKANEYNKLATACSCVMALAKNSPELITYSIPEITKDNHDLVIDALLPIGYKIKYCMDAALDGKKNPLSDLKVFQLIHASMEKLGMLKNA